MTSGSQAAYARYKEVSKQTVTDWKAMGLVVFNDDGEVDFDRTDEALADHGIRQPVDGEVDESGLEFTSADAKWTKAEAERVKENYAALLRQLEYDRETGKVVEIDDIIVAVTSEYAVVRNRLLGIGAKVAPELAAMSSAEEIKALIDREVVEALEQLTVDVDGERDFDKLRKSVQSRFGPTSDEIAPGAQRSA